MKTCKWFMLSVVGVFLAVLPGVGRSETVGECLKKAMTNLSLRKETAAFCIITNAGYVITDGRSTTEYIDTIQEITGCTCGSGRFLFYHRSSTKPLRIALFNKTTYSCMVITMTGGNATVTDVIDISLPLLGDDQKWSELKGRLGPDASTIVTFAHHWAAGAPYDYMKCAEFHNHLCPGMTTGYFIAKYIQQHLMTDENASYTFIACPIWCKDDAIQVLLDLTVGKKGIMAMNLTKTQLAKLKDSSVAGIFLVSKSDGSGATVYVLSYDWTAVSGLTESSGYTGMAARIRSITGLIPYYKKPEMLVRVLETKNITSKDAARMMTAGTNPYEVIGFTK